MAPGRMYPLDIIEFIVDKGFRLDDIFLFLRYI